VAIYGHLARPNLAALALERATHDEAVRLCREVLAEGPGDRETRDILKWVRYVSHG
jgi:hypothetical protein